MEEQIKNLLEGEIKTSIKNLSTLESGSKEKAMAVDDVVKLYRLKIEETKTESELLEKSESSATRGQEQKFKMHQLEEQVKDRYFRWGVEVAGLVFSAYWIHKGFKFEETGSINSDTQRRLLNRFMIFK